MKTAGYIGAAILVFFGVLFVWGAFGANGQPAWIVVGVISILAGLALIFFIQRKAKAEAPVNVTLKVDLPGEMEAEALKCKSCGGSLGPDNVELKDGGAVVNCPYCGTTYQLTEAPKW